MSLGKCNIVRLRQMLRRWRSKARMSAHRIPSDVPAGHVAVCVGTNSRRFVVRATYLNHPVFKKLLVEAEEEYGFSNHGLLAIPCDEALFEQLLRFISRSDCHLALRNNLHFYLQSLPLLHWILSRRQSGAKVVHPVVPASIGLHLIQPFYSFVNYSFLFLIVLSGE